MSRAKKVLLVEDDKVLSEMYITRFNEESFEVQLTGSGEEAKNLLQNNEYDLVLLDIMLPGISGLDVLAWVRENEKLKNLPVFLLSALSTDEDKMRGKELGATGYLAKSETTPEQIVDSIKGALKE